MKPSTVQSPAGNNFSIWWLLKAWGAENDLFLPVPLERYKKRKNGEGKQYMGKSLQRLRASGLPPCSLHQIRKSKIKNAQAYAQETSLQKKTFFLWGHKWETEMRRYSRKEEVEMENREEAEEIRWSRRRERYCWMAPGGEKTKGRSQDASCW